MIDSMSVPCGEFVERDDPECMAGRKVPEDCTRDCGYYRPGLSDQERRRALSWREVRAVHDDDRR